METAEKAAVKHTPGTWEADFHHILKWRILVRLPGALKKKILITGLSEPDARLIAAAPELKKQLEHTAMEYHQKVCGTLRLHNCENPLCVRNKAAIANAQ